MKLFIGVLLFFVSTTTFCQDRISPEDEEKMKTLCETENGIEEVKKILDKINTKGRGYQAAALKIGYDELLTMDAEDKCLSYTSEDLPESKIKGVIGKQMIWFYNSYECKSDWNNSCEGDEDLILPDGWQACSIKYTTVSQRGKADNPVFTPIMWREGDSEYPYRFRGYHMKLRSTGNNEFLNRVGANISLRNIYILAIPSSFTNEDRYRLGCDMPVYPASKTVVKKKNPSETKTSVNKYKADFIYYSKKCSYDVYKAIGGGTINCDDWIYVGKITTSNSVKLTLNPSDNILVRIMKNGADVCSASKIKEENNLSLNTNVTASSVTKREIHDWNCD